MNVYIFFGTWLLFWIAGYAIAKKQPKINQPIGSGWLISLIPMLIFGYGFLYLVEKKPVASDNVTETQISDDSKTPSVSNEYSFEMIEAMQQDAEKIHLWTQQFKNDAEYAFEAGNPYPLGRVHNEIEIWSKKIWNERGETAQVFQICDDNLISDLTLYNLAMLAKLDGKERAEHELPFFKDEFYKNYELCKDVIYRKTALEIYNEL